MKLNRAEDPRRDSRNLAAVASESSPTAGEARSSSVGELLRRLPREQPGPALRTAVLERARRIDQEVARAVTGTATRGPVGKVALFLDLRRIRTRQPWLVAAALAAALVLGFLTAPWLERPNRQMSTNASQRSMVADRQDLSPRADQLARLRSDYQALEAELQSLRRLVAESQPVVGLGGSDRVDLLVDLRDLVPALPTSGSAKARSIPVSYR